jgi:nucleoside-diphosphate-sugar epimerase
MLSLTSVPVLVTGASGFIGSHLVRRLVREGAAVHALVRPKSSLHRIADVQNQVTLWQSDLSDAARLKTSIESVRPQVIFHLAAGTAGRRASDDVKSVRESLESNLVGTLNLIEAIESAKLDLRCLIRAGGLEEYGNGPFPYDERQRESPVSAYSASQVATTHVCQMITGRTGLPIVTIRPALTYGPGQSSDFFIPSLIAHALRGEDFTMTSGQQTRDLLYIDDLIEAFIRAATATGIAGHIINIGSGRDYRIIDVAHAIVRITGSKIQLKVGDASERPSQIRRLLASIDRARELLNWTPQIDLETGLARTIESYSSGR